MKFCTKCGAKLPDNAMFCTTCGNKIEVQADPQRANIPERTVLEHIPEVKPQYAPQPQVMVQPPMGQPMMPTQVVNTAPVDDLRKHALAVFGYKFGMFFSAVFSGCAFVFGIVYLLMISNIRHELVMNLVDYTWVLFAAEIFSIVLGLSILVMFFNKYNAEKKYGFKINICSHKAFDVGIVLAIILDFVLAFNLYVFFNNFSEVSKYLSEDAVAVIGIAVILIFAMIVSLVNMFMSLCMVESARCKSEQ